MTITMHFSLKTITLSLFFLVGLSAEGNSQNLFTNGSFEVGTPGASMLPKGWYSCGTKGYTPPDLHSTKREELIFNVSTKAQDGNQFVSLVVRKDLSIECLGQELNSPLMKDSTYSLEIHLNYSETFESRTEINSKNASTFDLSADLEVYGLTKSGMRVLLDVYVDIDHSLWKRYQTTFKAKENYSALEFKSYFRFDQLLPYNGHILIDNLSLTSL